MANRSVLITGAAGFLAAHVIRRLRETHSLTLTDRAAPPEEFADLPFTAADITDDAAMARLCKGQEAVVHLAALVRGRERLPHTTFADVMVKGFWNVAQACVTNRVSRVVNVSSVTAWGWPTETQQAWAIDAAPVFRAGDLNYSLSKGLAETVGNAFHQAHGLQVIHLRPGILAGDGANGEPKALEGTRPPHWFAFVDARDVAQAVELALGADIPHGAFYITAARDDALFDWHPAWDTLGYRPEHNWPEIV